MDEKQNLYKAYDQYHKSQVSETSVERLIHQLGREIILDATIYRKKFTNAEMKKFISKVLVMFVSELNEKNDL